jgi:hypothetical protein
MPALPPRRDPDLAPHSADITPLACSGERDAARDELRFERIDTDLDAAEMRRLLSRRGQRMVGFDWDAGTGELFYAAHTELTAPALPSVAAYSRVVGSCVSR